MFILYNFSGNIQGGSGYARRITFSGITLDNVENPIIIDQHYNNGGSEKNTDDKVLTVKLDLIRT